MVNAECVERIIKHEAQPSALLFLETHSKFAISGRVRAKAGTLTGLVCVYGEQGNCNVYSCKLAIYTVLSSLSVFLQIWKNALFNRALDGIIEYSSTMEWNIKALPAQWVSSFSGK